VGITGDWDQRITRRTLLKTGGSFAAGITLAGIASGPAFGQAIFADNPFTLGIASGDPSPTGVVLWTRLAPDPLAVGGGMPAEPFEVRYELSQDEDFHAIVRKGSSVALPDEAHSVREEIDGLGPEHHYFYRFKVGDWISPVGRTRTRPPGNSMVRSVTFAFVSCQNFAEGYFTPYRDVADAQDIEAVIFLGDYIYEGRNTTIRTHMPQIEVRTLDDYRIRHGQYKTDEGLQKAHAAHRGSSPGTTTSSTTTTPTRISTRIRRGASKQCGRGAPPHTGPTGSTCRSHAPASRRDPTSSCTGASRGARWRRSTCSMGVSTAPTSP
jgi:phosphodiesterase/alkaline phosphatase D-like protein